MDEGDFRHALLKELVEEPTEARSAAPEELATELADLLEVLVPSLWTLVFPKMRCVLFKPSAEGSAAALKSDCTC